MFGSTIKGSYTAASDIDMLIVLDEKPNPQEEAETKAEIHMKIDAPIQLHIATQKQLETWYKKFIDKIIEIT